MKLFILALPIMTFSIMDVAGQALLISYVVAGIVILGFMQHKNNLRIYLPLELKIYGLFLCYCLFILGIIAYQGSIAFKNITQFITYFMYFILYIVFVNIIAHKKWEQINLYINIFILITVFAALFTMFQTITPGNSIFFNFLRNDNTAFYAMRPNELIGGHSGLGGLNRVVGFAPESSMWAAYLCVPLGILVARLIKKISAKELLMFMIMFVSFVLSYGRTGWLAFVAAILYLPYFFMKKHKNMYIAFISMIMVGIFFSSLVTNLDYSKADRLKGMVHAWEMFLANPAFGVGLGGFVLNSDKYLRLLPQEQLLGFITASKALYAYNLFLKILAETGMIGFLLWTGVLFIIWRKIAFCFEKSKSNEAVNTLCLGLAFSFLSIIFSWLNIEGFNLMYIWLIFAMISAVYIKLKKELAANAAKT